jgi:hypothetical protein
VSKKEGAKQSKTKQHEKKILLLTVCIQLLASCGYACIDTSKLVVITSIAGLSATIMAGNSGMTYNIWTSELFKMRDICGKSRRYYYIYKSKDKTLLYTN